MNAEIYHQKTVPVSFFLLRISAQKQMKNKTSHVKVCIDNIQS